jgi:autotransporter-associated beta strand protein
MVFGTSWARLGVNPSFMNMHLRPSSAATDLKNQTNPINPMKTFAQRLLIPLIVSALTLLPARPVSAASDTWSGGAGGGNGNWNVAGNWGGTAPVASDYLFFDTSTQTLTTNNFPAGTIFGNIQFNSGAGAFTNNGNSLILTNTVDAGDGFAWNGSISNASSSAQIILHPITIAPGNHYLATIAGSGKLNLNGAITRSTGAFVQFSTNSGGINLTGSGITTNGLNNILGGWAVIGMGANVGGWATLDNNSNVIAYAGYTTVASGTAIASNGAANIKITQNTASIVYQLTGNGSTTNVSVNSIVWGVNQGGMFQVGPGTNLILGAHGGIMHLSGGTGSGGFYNSGNKVVTNGPAIANGAGTMTAGTTASGGEIALLNSSFFGANNDLQIYPSITDNAAGGPVSVVVMGYVNLNSTNTYSGGTFINQGRITGGGGHALGSGPVYVYPGGELFNTTLTNLVYISGVGTTEYTSGSPDDGLGAFRSVTCTGPLILMGNASVGRGSLSGQTTGQGSLIIGSGLTANGSGTTVVGSLNGPNSYTGDTVINFPTNANYTGTSANTLQITSGANNIMPSGPGKGNVILNGVSASSWPTFDLNGTVQTINGLYAMGADAGNSFVENDLSLSAATLVVGADNSSPTYGGVLRDHGSGTGTLALTKIGTGTFTLTVGGSPADGYTGNTTVSNGVLALSGTVMVSNTPQFIVKSGATLDVSGLSDTFILNPVSTVGQTLTGNGNVNGNVLATNGSRINLGSSTLTFNNNLTLATGVTNLFTLSATTNGANGKLAVTGNLDVSAGSVTISINYATLQIGRYKLITYGTANPVNPVVSGDLSLVGFAASGVRQSAVLDDSIPGEIDLVVAGAAGNLTWVGDNSINNWDVIATTNWINNGSSSLDQFFNGDIVTFNDTGSKTPSVNLTAAGIQPSSLMVSNNSGTYTFGGSGNLAGNFTLTKQGTGTLVLTEAGDAFTGGIAISNGMVVLDNNSGGVGGGATIASGSTLQLGNSDANGVLPSGTVTMNGALNFKRNDSAIIPVANIIGGGSTGALTINPGNSATVVAISGANTFSGSVTVVSGTLQVSNNAALGATNGATTISNGTALDVFGHNVGQEPIFVSGIGILNNDGSTNGAIYNSGGSVFPAVQRVTLLGDTVFGGRGRWDLRSSTTSDSTGASLVANGYNLIKVGTNQVSITGVTVDPTLGNIDVQGGILSIESATTGLGNPASTLTVEYGANLSIYQTTNLNNKNFVLYGNGVTNVGTGLLGALDNTSGNNTIVGPMTLNGDVEITFRTAAGAANQTGSLTLSNTISGTGMLGKDDTNTLTISGTNTYTGNTMVNAGTLALRGKGSIGGSAQIIVSNATLDVTALTIPFTISTNSLVLTSGSVFVLGNGLATNINNLLFTNSTLQMAVTNPGVANITVTNLADADTTSDPTVTNWINITALPNTLAMAQFPLIKYTTFVGTFNFGLSNLPVGAVAYLTNNAVNNSVDLVVTALPNAVWNGGSLTTANWSDNANWGGINLGASDNIFFAGNTRVINNNDTAADTVYSNLTFNAGPGTFVLNGNSIAITGNVTNNSSNPQTINLGLDFPTNIVLNGAAGTLIIGNGLTNTEGSGVATVTLAGTGILTNLLNDTAATIISPSSSSANWTLVDNPISEAITVPAMSFSILGGSTFNFGNAGSAPNLTVTAGSGTDNTVGNGTGTSTFNMVNGTLTLPVRMNTAGNGNINVSGGTLNVAAQMQNANGAATDVGFITVSGGTLNVGTLASPGSSTFDLASRGTGTLTISGGLVECGTMDMSRNIISGTTATINLDGGTLQARLVSNATHQQNATAGSASATFNFNGGTLKAGASSATFFQGSIVAPIIPITAIVKSGGAIIDDNNHTITIVEPLQHDSSLGDTADGGLIKNGVGTLTLSAANTYTGPTVVSNGTLLVSGSLSTNTVTVATGATLSGAGTINGAVTIQGGGTLQPGSSAVNTDTLTLGKSLNLAGTALFALNRNNAQNSSRVSVNTPLTYGGTLTVTNVSDPVQLGDAFTLFIAPSRSGNFAGTNLPVLDSSLAWNWNPANSVLSVVSGVNTSPTNITASVSGSTLTLSWPADHTGWRLLVQTNNLAAGVSANTNDWMTVLGSAGINQTNITMDPAKPAEFYRLVYP